MIDGSRFELSIARVVDSEMHQNTEDVHWRGEVPAGRRRAPECGETASVRTDDLWTYSLCKVEKEQPPALSDETLIVHFPRDQVVATRAYEKWRVNEDRITLEFTGRIEGRGSRRLPRLSARPSITHTTHRQWNYGSRGCRTWNFLSK